MPQQVNALDQYNSVHQIQPGNILVTIKLLVKKGGGGDKYDLDNKVRK